MLAGERPAGATIRSPVAWIAGWRETKTLKPIDNASAGEATTHRAVTTVNAKVASKVSSPEGRAPNRRAKAACRSRNLIDAAPTLRRGGSDSTVTRTCRATGEALLVPARNRRSRVGRITGETGKSAEEAERVAAGSAMTMKQNDRGAKGPCHLQRLRRKEGKDEMTKASIDLQDLRRRIYVKVKAELLRRFWISTFVYSGAKGPRAGNDGLGRAESRLSRIGPISLGVKQMGARRAGNPHAACDVAGAGNAEWSRWCDTRRRKALANREHELRPKPARQSLDPSAWERPRSRPPSACTARHDRAGAGERQDRHRPALDLRPRR